MANDSIFTPLERVAIVAALNRMGDIGDSLKRIADALERAYPPPEPEELPEPEKKGWFS